MNRTYHIFLIGCIMQWVSAVAQTPPSTPTGWPAGTKPAYVRTWEATTPQTDATLLAGKSLGEVKQTTVYMDGLGRPMQTVVRQGALPTQGGVAQAKDLVTAMWQDEAGRETRQYLPFASAGADGSFKPGAFEEQRAFYEGYWAVHSGETNIGGTGRNWALGLTGYEASPMNRVVAQYAAGAAWAGSHQAAALEKRGAKVEYRANTLDDAVRLWTVEEPLIGQFATLSSATIYAADRLNRIATTDEHGRQTVVYKDKMGNDVLVQVQNTDAVGGDNGSQYQHWHYTYHIYDAMGKLRCTITPRGVELLAANSWVLTAGILEHQCYRYEYDNLFRQIIEKTPGIEPVYNVYDQRGRAILSQDGNLRPHGKWMVTLYDKYDRPVQTGIWTNTGNNTLSNMVAWGNTVPAGIFPFDHANPPASGWERHSRTGYDDYAGFPTGVGMTAAYDNTYTGNGNYFITTHHAAPHYAEPIAENKQTRGLVTWTETKSETGGYLYTAQFYDYKGRIIQVKKNNAAGGADIITTQYNFSGQPVRVLMRHSTGIPVQTTLALTQYRYDELGRATMTEQKVQHTLVNNDAQPPHWNRIAQVEYDLMGVMVKKELGGLAGNDGNRTQAAIQTLVYSYNVRGWAAGVNRDYLTTNAHAGQTRFGYEIAYHTTGSITGQGYTGNGLYNGQINGITWKASGDGVRRRYSYAYDGLGQMLKANFVQHNTDGTGWNANKVNYTEQIGNGSQGANAYDANGNIKGLTRHGYRLHTLSSAVIDQLSYHYRFGELSNQLQYISDGQNDPQTTMGDFRTSVLHTQSKNAATEDYTYDPNGNLTRDYNKDVATAANGAGISYNHLDLPTHVQVKKQGGGLVGDIEYKYDATGGKLRKKVQENAVSIPWPGGPLSSDITTTSFYADGFVYETKIYGNTTLKPYLDYTMRLQYILHGEGRIRFVAGATAAENKLVYDYNITDHVGNVRVVLTEEAQAARPYTATMEDAARAGEEDWFEGIGSTVYDKPTGFDGQSGNQKVSQLFNVSGQDKRIGPAIALKVMAGDKFTAAVRGWYLPGSTNTTPGSQPVSFESLAGAIFGSGLPVGSKIPGAVAATGLPVNILPFIQNRPETSGRPKAFLNWMLLDELELKLDASVQGAVPIPVIADDMPAQLMQAAGGAEITIPKNGYLFVFVSNESQGSVYFDDLTVTHTPGPLLEEHHYYPTGLEMFALSSSAGNGHVRNRYGYQGQEWENTFALNLNEFEARHYDAQIGRWMVPDPANQFPSPYVGMGNQWVSGVDPDGRAAFVIAPFLIAAAKGAAIASATYVASNFVSGNTWKDLNFSGWATSAALGAVGGAFSHGVGNAFLGAKPGIMTEVSKAAVHGQFNAILSGAMGGDPLAGFAAGFGGSLVGALTPQSWGTLGRLGVSMAVGGGGAALAGGDFLKGATVAGIGFLTNQLAHEIIDQRAIELIKAYDAYPSVQEESGNYADMDAGSVFEALGGGIYENYQNGTFTNACASRLSLAFIRAGVRLPKHFLDKNGNGVITSAEKMFDFMSKRYGYFMRQWDDNSNQRGFYIGVTKPGYDYSGHVSKVGSNFSANFHSGSMERMAFWRVPELNFKYLQMIVNNKIYKPLW